MPSSWSMMPLLDPATWQDFLELWRDDEPSVTIDLLNEFLAEADRHRELMRDALMRGDAKALEFSAHSMKSSSGNLGALRLQEISRALQDLGRDGSVSVAQEYFRHFERVLDQTRAALVVELPELAT